jgi:putative transposase
MKAPYSLDLRERALARKEAGETNREIAAALWISPSCVAKWTKQARDGLAGPGSDRRLQTPHALGRERRLAAGAHRRRAVDAARLVEAERGIKTRPRAVWVFVRAEGLSFKKNAAGRRTDAS